MAARSQLVRALPTWWRSAKRLHSVGTRIAVAGALYIASTGCQHSPAYGRVFVIPRVAADAAWLSEHVGIAEASQQLGIPVYWNGPSEDSDVQGQLDQIARAIREHALGIVIEPNSTIALNRSLEAAVRERIPVVLMAESVDLPQGKHIGFVLTDLHAFGSILANRLGDVLQHQGSVMLVGLDISKPGSIDRADAISSALARSEGGIQIVARQPASVSPSRMAQDLIATLRAGPTPDAVVALDARSSYAADFAVRSLHLDGRVHVLACDQSLDMLHLLRHGLIDSILVPNLRVIAALSLAEVKSMRAGTTPGLQSVVPVLVTRDNIDTEPIQQLLLMHRERR